MNGHNGSNGSLGVTPEKTPGEDSVTLGVHIDIEEDSPMSCSLFSVSAIVAPFLI